MKPYQERVVIEESELNENINRLYRFLANDASAVSGPESTLIKIQLAAMTTYRLLLAARIETFHKDVE